MKQQQLSFSRFCFYIRVFYFFFFFFCFLCWARDEIQQKRPTYQRTSKFKQLMNPWELKRTTWIVSTDGRPEWNHGKHAKIQIGPKTRRVVSKLFFVFVTIYQISNSEMEKTKQKINIQNKPQRLMVFAGVYLCVRPLFGKIFFFFLFFSASFCCSGIRSVLFQFMFLVINLKIQFFNFGPIKHQTVAYRMYVRRAQ